MFELLLLLSICVSLLAGQFARIELINSLANVYFHEFLILIFIVFSFRKQGFKPLLNFCKSKWILVFFGLTFFSFVLSFNEFSLLQNSVAFLYLGRVSLFLLFSVYLYGFVKNSKDKRNFIMKLIYIFSILLIIMTVLQYIFFPNFWSLYSLGWDPHLYRATATYLDVFISAAIYGLFALFWYSKKRKLLSFLFIIALLLSFSRSAYGAFILSILYLFITQKKWKELFLSLILFVTLIIIVPKPFGEGGNLLRTSSINSRISDYSLGLSLWQKKPLFGFGYNRIRFAKEQLNLTAIDDKSHSLSSFHSSFLILLVTSGIFGLISFVGLIIYLFKKYPYMRVYGIYIFTMSLFDNVLLHVLVMMPFLFLAIYLSQSSLE